MKGKFSSSPKLRYSNMCFPVTFLALIFMVSCKSQVAQDVGESKVLGGGAGVIADTASLINYIETKQPRTIDDILPNLSTQFRENYVLIHTSRSTHETSVSYPRIVTYNPEQNTIFAISGNSDLRGGYNIETATFDKISGEFRFKGLTLKPVPGSDRRRLIEDSKSCLSCHGSVSPRPIWDTYRIWPGVYGAAHGFDLEKEASDYSRFMENKNKGRYAYFQAPPLDVGFGHRTVPNSLPERKQANTEFSTFLEVLNMRRIAAEVRKKAGPEGVASLCGIFKAATQRMFALKSETAKEGARWLAKNPNAKIPDFEKIKQTTEAEYEDYLENRLLRLAATLGVKADEALRRRNNYISIDFIPYSIGLNYLSALYGIDPAGWTLAASSLEPSFNRGKLLFNSLVVGAGHGAELNLQDSGACTDLIR